MSLDYVHFIVELFVVVVTVYSASAMSFRRLGDRLTSLEKDVRSNGERLARVETWLERYMIKKRPAD